MSDEPPKIMDIEDARQTLEWGDGHPVIGPLGRAGVQWWDEKMEAEGMIERLRAVVRLVDGDHMTPMGRRLFDQVFAEWDDRE